MKYSLIFAVISILCSCQSSNKHNNEEVGEVATIKESAIVEKKKSIPVDTERDKPVSKANMKTNDGFRNKVVSSMASSNDVEVFNRILDKLDQKDMSVCDVIGKLFAIDDQSFANAKRQIPDASQQESFSKVYTSGIKQGYEKYARSIGITMDEIRFLNTAYAFHQPVKSFCGNF